MNQNSKGKIQWKIITVNTFQTETASTTKIKEFSYLHDTESFNALCMLTVEGEWYD